MGIGRDGDLRLDGISVGGDHVAVLVQVESAGARIGDVAGGAADLEETAALDDHVERIAGGGEIALREDDLVRGSARAQSKLQAGGNHGLLSGGGAGLENILIHEVLELRAAHLVAGGVGVGQVVGDVIDVHLLGVHAAGSAVECSDHADIPPAASWATIWST